MNYPTEVSTLGKANPMVLDLIKALNHDKTPVRNYAEIGVYTGDTAHAVAHLLEPGASMQLFDFEHQLKEVEERFRADVDLEQKDLDVRLTPNTTLTYDSYCWSLANCLMEQLSYDFIFIDGAHTWHHDGMAFMLADKMLQPGGYIVFDDLSWTISTSKSLRPAVFPQITEQYTEQQIGALQVKMIIELLVKPDPRYEEVIEGFAYQKVTPIGSRSPDNRETCGNRRNPRTSCGDQTDSSIETGCHNNFPTQED